RTCRLKATVLRGRRPPTSPKRDARETVVWKLGINPNGPRTTLSKTPEGIVFRAFCLGYSVARTPLNLPAALAPPTRHRNHFPACPLPVFAGAGNSALSAPEWY